MEITRREFIQGSAGAAIGISLGILGFDLSPVKAYAQTYKLKIKDAKETTSVCCYCAVGCGVIVHTRKNGDKRAINIEGNPDHIINKGALCSKGSSLFQLVENKNRLTEPMYRAPYSDKWSKVSWDWAIDKIAGRIKETRDNNFTFKNDAGQTVNRTTAIASVGSAAMDNEECWLYQGFLRSLGLVYVEHQARI